MLPFWSSSVITVKSSDIRPKTVRQKLSVLSVEKATLTKDAQTEKNSNPNVLTVKDHMLQTIKGVQLIKNRCSVNMWWTTKKICASILKQNLALPPQPQGATFTFTANQLVKFVAPVAIQITQQQVCYTTAPKDAVDKKSSLCQRVSEAAKSQLGISISGSTLFDAIGYIRAPVLPASKFPVVKPEPFHFSVSTTKPPTILNSHSPLLLLTRLPPNSLTPLNRTSPVGHLS